MTINEKKFSEFNSEVFEYILDNKITSVELESQDGDKECIEYMRSNVIVLKLKDDDEKTRENLNAEFIRLGLPEWVS
jgi:hypothetical protein